MKKQKIKNGWELFIPPIEYTTDNAAMIGIGGYFKLNERKYGNLSDESKITFANLDMTLFFDSHITINTKNFELDPSESKHISKVLRKRLETR